MSNLALRLLSAAVLLPPVMAAFIFGGAWLKGLIFVVAVVCLHEYGTIVAKDDRRSRWALLIVGATATAVSLLVQDPVHALLVLQLSMIAFASFIVLSPVRFETAWQRLSMLTFGVLYIGLGLISVGRLRDLGDPLAGPAEGVFVIVAFTATWANDTCAYFAGRAFGKHKMNEVVSPKKTWEGFIGGAVGTLAFLLGGRFLLPAVFAPVSYLDLVLVGIPAALFGPVGDLAESTLKRNFDVKDSGKILPGHGGMLDRVDAVFFVAPWTFGYFVLLKPLVDQLVG